MNLDFFLLTLTLVGLGVLGCDAALPAQDFEGQRHAMVEQQLRARDITSPRVLDAMRKVPRHLFIPDDQRREAYGDFPVPRRTASSRSGRAPATRRRCSPSW
jgi:hypothetical protein